MLEPSVPSIGGNSGLAVSLPQFEGPLDLLLHLVRSNDMDILNIEIRLVAKQYNEYLDRMRLLDLEVASEYLVLAATLAHIKSRLMVPSEPTEPGEAVEDPRAELTRALLEYERYKQAAEELAALESGRDLVFVRPGPPPADLAGVFMMKVDLTDLVAAFGRVLSRLEASEGFELIRREDFPIENMMQRLRDLTESAGRILFSSLLDLCRTRLERVVAFLALLELVRMGQIEVWQSAPRSEIEMQGMTIRSAPDEETH
jgi:segregation and condensation protein A